MILFLLITRALSESSKVNGQQLWACSRGSPGRSFARSRFVERFKDKVAVVIPAYNEAESVAEVIDGSRQVCGVDTAILVVDDGSRDDTTEVAEGVGAVVARHVINRGGGAALRTGYRLMADAGAKVVVTLDADGQHLPRRWSAWSSPSSTARSTSPTARACSAPPPPTPARELGIVFFNRLVSFITRTHVTDCSNGYRAVRARCCRNLVLRQEQFHTSEFLIEAIKRGVPAKEVPVTVVERTHGHSKKPAVVPLRRRLRQRHRPYLAALASPAPRALKSSSP